MNRKVAINITIALLCWMCCMVAIIAQCAKGMFTSANLTAEGAGLWHKTISIIQTAVNELQSSLDSLAEGMLNALDAIFNFLYCDYCDFILNLF